MRHYTTNGRVLGYRCTAGHGGNRRLYVDQGMAACGGCGRFYCLTGLQFPSRADALAADRGKVATWPEDTAGAVLSGEGR